MSNTSSIKKTIAIFVLTLVATNAVAKVDKKKKTKAKTVGELLKKADQTSKAVQESKSKTNLPQFNEKIFNYSKSTNVDLNKVKPPRTSVFMEDAQDDKAKLEKITDQQIQELFKLTKKFKSSPRRGELWLRLAELYVEKASVIDYRKQTEYDQKLKDYYDGKTKTKPILDLADARDFNKRAIQLYEWFVRDFPKDDKIDQALFFLGYNNFELGNIKKGLSYYTRLTKEFSNSLFITESHFALGEYYFENEKWQNALAHYLEVAKHRHHRLYGFSTYKVAWCYYRTGDSKKALLTMERLINENRQAQKIDGEGKKVSKVRLEKEGLRDIVLFYVDESNPFKAPEYFNKLAGSDSLNYLEKLAYLYVEKGNREGAKYLFNYLIQKNPENPKAFDYKYQIILAFSTATKTKEFREEMYDWIKTFNVESKWYKANIKNKELTENANRLRETTLKNWILTQHQTAQNSHSKFSQSLANEGYNVFLSEFADSKSIADMHFFYAELLYDMDKFDEAGVHYKWVVDNAADSKYGPKAAENIVLAIGKSIPTDKEISAVIGKSIDPVQFSIKIEKFIKVSMWYLEKFPNSDKTAEIKFRVGRLYYQHNQFDKAIPFFKEIVKKYPNTKFAEYSANLLLDIYNLKKDYAGLEKAAQELLAVKSISNSSAGQDIRKVLERAQFKKAQDLEGASKFAQSADEYVIFAKENSKSNLVPAAYFNSAINYEKAGENSKAISSHQQLLSIKSKEADGLKIKSHKILAKLYQDAGLIEESVQMYKQSLKDNPQDKNSSNIIYNIAILEEALGHEAESLKYFNDYLRQSKSEDKYEVYYQKAQILKKNQKKAQAVDEFRNYFNSATRPSEKTIESAYWNYEYYRDLQKFRESENWKKKILSQQKQLSPNKKGVGAHWAAKVLLDDVKYNYAQMRNIKIPANPKKQQEMAQKKIEMLNEINKKLAETIKYDSAEEIVGALILLAKSNHHLGEALTDSPVPKQLKPEEAKLYKEEIKKIADPFYVKAKEGYKTAVQRASELEVYGSDYDYAKEMLAKFEGKPILKPDFKVMSFKQPVWVSDEK